MAKIIFGDDLYDKFTQHRHIRDSKNPFSTWIVKPIKVKGQNYYLYIEQSTKLAITARFLDKHKFYNTLLSDFI